VALKKSFSHLAHLAIVLVVTVFQMLIDAAELMGEKRKTACITCTLNKYVE
jgi:hypothetical protein